MKKLVRYIYVYMLGGSVLLALSSCTSTPKDGSSDKPGSAAKVNGTTAQNGNTNDSYTFDPQKPYPYESGVVEYQYTGDYDGKQTIYFTDYGRTFRVEEDYVNNMTPAKAHVNQVFIKAGDKFYFYDNDAKKGYYANLKDSNADFQGNLLHDFTTIGIDSTMRKNGYKKAGQLDVSGKKCQVYTSADGKSKFCFWNGINIKTDMKLGQQFDYTLEAVNIDKKSDIDNSEFAPPSGIKMLPYDKYVKSETKDKL